MKNPLTLILCLVLFACYACVSVPRESVELSKNLGMSIQETQRTHVALLKSFFDEKRDKVDLYLNEVWIPEFSNQLYNIPAVQNEWDRICTSGSGKEKQEFIVGMGIKIQERINKKRDEMMAPLDEAEKLLEEELLVHYNNLQVSNTILTNYLASAANVKKTQVEILSALGVNEKEYRNTLDAAYSFMGEINNKVDILDEGKEQTEEYLDTINALIKQLKAKENAGQ